MLLLAGGLVLGGDTGGRSAGQSALEVTVGGGGDVAVVLFLGGLLGSSDNGAGYCFAAKGTS